MRTEATKKAAADFQRVLEGSGLREALGFLNARTRHRYTGLYRFDPPMLRAVWVFDRENPMLCGAGDVPMRESYCSLVGEANAPMLVRDAASDARLLSHPARASILAYCGVPVRLGDGRCVGTLCHFDFRPRIAATGEVALLEFAAARLAPRVAAVAPDHARLGVPEDLAAG